MVAAEVGSVVEFVSTMVEGSIATGLEGDSVAHLKFRKRIVQIQKRPRLPLNMPALAIAQALYDPALQVIERCRS